VATWPSSWKTTSTICPGLGGAALGALLHGPQQPSAQQRGSVHPRRLRRHDPRRHSGHGRGRLLLDLGRIPTRLVVGGALPGFDDYRSSAEQFEPTPSTMNLKDGRCSTRPVPRTAEGVRKTLPATPLGDPTAAPVQIAMGMAGRASGRGPSTCLRHRSTTRRRSFTRCRCSDSAPPS